jgi:hypothetical protein
VLRSYSPSTLSPCPIWHSRHSFWDLHSEYERALGYLSVSLWLIPLSMGISRSIHFLRKGKLSSSLCRLPRCLYPSAVDEHLGWRRGLATMSSAAVNVGVRLSLLYADSHSFRHMSGVAQQGHMVPLVLVFWGPSTLTSIAALLFSSHLL